MSPPRWYAGLALPRSVIEHVSQRPNIVYIVADDLGYADLGCYGGREPGSPVIDRLAAEGLRLTQGYANWPVCSPTRFALMTGRYPYRCVGAADMGKLFRPDNPLLSNYKWVPIGYHGRASTINPSPSAFKRPLGQQRAPGGVAPRLARSARLDYELEVGFDHRPPEPAR